MVGPAFCLTSVVIKTVAVSWLKVCALIPVNDTQVQFYGGAVKRSAIQCQSDLLFILPKNSLHSVQGTWCEQ